MSKFKYQDGDLIGPSNIRMVHRLDKINGKWIGEFECPECHKIFKASLSNIQSGTTKSCGCLPKSKPNDLTGRIFGRLTVLKYISSDKNGVLWLCQCSCDEHNVIKVYGSNLTKGRTQSCGCLQKERTSQSNFKDLSNQKFGKLTPLYTIGKYKSFYIWHCICECGNYADVVSANLINGNTKSCGCLKSYGEEIISSILRKKKIHFERNKTFSSLINPQTKHHLFLDFYLPDYNCAIECDGEQHYKNNLSGYYTPKKISDIRTRDLLKQQWCNKNGIILYRIKYPSNCSIDNFEREIYGYLHTIQKSL